MAREVRLYSKERCVQCNASERKLKDTGVEFIHDDATTEENLAFIRTLDEGYRQAPIMTVSEDGVVVDHWTGYRPDKIDELAAA